MTPERWHGIVQMIRDKYLISQHYTEELHPGSAEVVEFKTPHGSLKARFVQRPRVVDKKTLYSRRSGSGVAVDYTYDASQEVCHLELYRWNEESDSWQKLEKADSLL